MAKRVDTFQQKISRNDRFAQMSQQEKIIEQKKKEILAKLEAKETTSKSETAKNKSDVPKPATKITSVNQKEVKNIFTNDGSFLDQFKQLKDKRLESKIKSFGSSKENSERNYSEEKNKNRWVPRRRSPSPRERTPKRFSRFSNDKGIGFEPKITINTSFSSNVTSQNFDVQSISVTPHEVTGQPLLKNLLPQQQSLTYPDMVQQTETVQAVITAPPVLLDVPPPQIVQGQISSTLVLTPASTQNVLVSTPLQPILTTVNLQPTLVTTNVTQQTNIQQPLPVPASCLPTIELGSIPPPNPIQLQNIPQPEPLNTLSIPQPAPIQVQNIPTPNQIQLNEIPNPKPMDLLAIPTPAESKGISDPDFLKNIPPPNKAVPPPQIKDNSVSLLPASQAVTTSISVAPNQNVLVHNIPPSQIQTIQNIHAASSNTMLQNAANFSSVTVAVPVGVVQVSSTPTAIPSLMAQPILPPPGMGLNVNVNCPPPVLSGNGVQQQASSFINQPTTLSQQIPLMSIPPPSNMPVINTLQGYKNVNAVFPPGSPEYESMASLGRTVAECGESIEDIVRQGKNQDPNLWFLFHKESAAYQQYRQLVEQFKHEKEVKRQVEENQDIDRKPNLEDIYEPEKALEDTDYDSSDIKEDMKDDLNELDKNERKRKRKSRWGEKVVAIPPPAVVNYTPPSLPPVVPVLPQPSQQGPVMLSKVTRNNPALLQYVANTYGSTNLSEEDWKKAEDNYKIHLLYQDMLRKREEVERLQKAGKNKYEYDSDEDTEGGTWEHKAREKEMMATQLWAKELNRQAEGKHHIGDFLPPDELKKFLEKSNAAKEGRQPNFSDYKEFKIKEDNIGFKMLQKLGWTEGEGLGTSGMGIVEPINKFKSVTL